MNEGLQLLDPMPTAKVDEIVSFLTKESVLNAHVPDAASSVGRFDSVDWPIGCWPVFYAVNAPHWLEYALGTHRLAKDYFGESPLLYSVNAFFTQPSTRIAQPTHDWHRDHDDRKQLTVFMLCTDSDGAFLYVANSAHKNDGVTDYSGYEPPKELVRTVTGPRGTTFAADTNGLHMGVRPTNGRRIMLWARWGVSDPPAIYRHKPELFDISRLAQFLEEVKNSARLSIIGA